MKRRQFLTVIGIGPAIGAGGCLSGTEPAIQLGYLDLANFDTDPHQFDVRVSRDDETVHDSVQEVRAREGNRVYGHAVGCTWDETPGQYTVSASVDDGPAEKQPLTGESIGSDTDCVAVGIQYRTDQVTFKLSAGCGQDYDGMCPFTDRTRRGDDRANGRSPHRGRIL